MNAFPPKSAVSDTFSPQDILNGVKIEFNLYCKMPFVGYSQV